MNLKEDILNHIASHPEWDLFTKARWIYLKTCSFFSYDWKYFYVSNEDKRKIYQLELDIENIHPDLKSIGHKFRKFKKLEGCEICGQ